MVGKCIILFFALIFTVLFLMGLISNYVQFWAHCMVNKPFMANNGLTLMVELNAACAFWVWFASYYMV